MKNNPWIIKQEEEMASFMRRIEKGLDSKIATLKKHSLDNVLKIAVDRKKYDVYHSTTIEGYNITPKEVEAVILGKKLKDKSFEKIRNEMAILGHYYFVTIHPYTDGNGRCGRLIMNYCLAAAGYPWITIIADTRDAYFQALQMGQLEGDIIPFAKFIISLIEAA
ncbi:Fic family protein [Candidatus Saganbacteria bacterium]|nr:Fic family protein [Candidatus Saganbacteria bacterium]